MQRIRSFNSIATRAFKAPVFNNNMVKRNIVVNAAFNKAATDAHPAYTAKDALSKVRLFVVVCVLMFQLTPPKDDKLFSILEILAPMLT